MLIVNEPRNMHRGFYMVKNCYIWQSSPNLSNNTKHLHKLQKRIKLKLTLYKYTKQYFKCETGKINLRKIKILLNNIFYPRI